MKRILFYLLFIGILASCADKLSSEQSALLWKAYHEKNYFVLDHLMSSFRPDRKNPYLMLYRATLGNVFNRPQESTQLINTLLKKYPKVFNDTILHDLYKMRAENAGRLQDFAKAASDYSRIVTQYRHVCDSSELASLNDDDLFWVNLVNAPKMRVIKGPDSKIPLKRDKVGLFNVPVILRKDTIDFVFDTGANYSVITKSLAKKYGAEIQGGKVKIGSTIGIKVDAEVGVLDFRMGNMEIKNSVFLVIPDSLLSFGNGAYSIKGIVGLPVMYALQEIIIRDDKYVIIPKQVDEAKERNFAFDNLTPVIMVKYKNDTLPFHFDTGATNTDLYSAFFNRYKNEIISTGKKLTGSTGGVGGIVKSEAYVLRPVVLSAGNSECSLDSLRVSEKDLKGNDVKYIYGNFGQDYIRQFSEMRINFTTMNITFIHKQ